MTLPLAPLLRASGADHLPAGRWATGELCPITGLARMLNMHRRTIHRYALKGLSLDQADHAACSLNLHPANVWGREWQDAVDWDDPDWLVEVKRRHVRALDWRERRSWAA